MSLTCGLPGNSRIARGRRTTEASKVRPLNKDLKFRRLVSTPYRRIAVTLEEEREELAWQNSQSRKSWEAEFGPTDDVAWEVELRWRAWSWIGRLVSAGERKRLSWSEVWDLEVNRTENLIRAEPWRRRGRVKASKVRVESSISRKAA